MCSHLQFCSVCTPSAAIIAYSEGRAHLAPDFGDAAQREVANRLRRHRFHEVLRALEPGLYDWPEYRKRFGHSGHASRMVRLGRPVLLNKETMPDGLRQAFAETRVRIVERFGPKSFKTRNARREFKRTYSSWVRENLGETEMLILGRIVYGERPQDSIVPLRLAA